MTDLTEHNKNIDPTKPDWQVTAADEKIAESIKMLRQMESVDSERAIKKVKRKIDYKKQKRWTTILYKAAAIFLLPLLSFSVWQALKITSFNQSIVEHKITTPPTLRSVFELPDGTKVWLNGNTTIAYPSFFKGNKRLVKLNGEAYFEVAHDKKKPFLVKSGNILVEAVGTEFNCLTFDQDKRQEILLTEGKVNILSDKGGKNKTITSLKPGEMAVFNKNKETIEVKKVNPEKYIAWKDGIIIFKNDGLHDMLAKLERWYNVEFICDKNIKTDYAFTGTFNGEELSHILKCIEVTTPIKFEILKKQTGQNDMYKKTKIKVKNKRE